MSIVKSGLSARVKLRGELPNIQPAPGRNNKYLLQRIAQFRIVLSSG